MLVEPFADVPAHRNDAEVRVIFNIVDGKLDYFAGESLAATFRVGEGMGERDRFSADLVVNRAGQAAVDVQRIAVGLGVVGEFPAHDSSLPTAWAGRCETNE